MNSNANPVVQSLRRLDNKFEDTSADMSDFIRRQAAGDNPDPNEFSQMLAKMSTVKSAMEAQFQLLERPYKTVLNETR
jgi:hypothetical protein